MARELYFGRESTLLFVAFLMLLLLLHTSLTRIEFNKGDSPIPRELLSMPVQLKEQEEEIFPSHGNLKTSPMTMICLIPQ